MYEGFFGLEDAPFRLTPDPRYLFLSRKHADALAHLRLGLSESSGFVCITGDVGTGKTTVLRHFLGELAPEASVAYVINPTLSPVELLQTVNLEFGLPARTASRRTLIGDLNRHLLAQCAAGRRSVVVVDEAQALSVEVLEHLRLLSNLETTTEKLLRIVLVGQPQLRALLAHPELAQLNQRITLRWHIGPLDREETLAYVRHRLHVAAARRPAAGNGSRDVFTTPALRAIHRRSGGVPRLINMLCHRAMLAAFASERQRVGPRAVRTAYREVATLPLPGQAPPSPRPGWTGPALAAGVAALAIGVVGATPWLRTLALEAAPEPSGTPVASAAAAAEETAPSGVPDPMSTEPPDATPVAATAHVEVAAEPAVEAAPPPDPTPEVEARLAALAPVASARAALDAVLRTWQVPPLAPDEPAATVDLPRIAERRGLEHMAFTGNIAMLRLLDVPAVLELHIPGASGPRYAALVGVQDGGLLMAGAGDEPVAVERSLLEKTWYGQAHVFSRDFEALGPGMLDPQSRGARVVRLQGLLKRVGAYEGPESGLFDAATASAVLGFQRSRYVSADGIVGRLTRIALYAAAGGYPRPTLASEAGGAS